MINILQNLGFYVIPILIFLVISHAVTRKIAVFDAFLSGAEEGFNSTISLIPTLIALITGITMLKASGALDLFADLITPVCNYLKIPPQIVPLALMRPVSGSGSIALLDNIFANYGVDSVIGTAASMIMGSTETTFYTLTVYFGAIKIKNTRHSLFCAILADIFAIIIAILITKCFIF